MRHSNHGRKPNSFRSSTKGTPNESPDSSWKGLIVLCFPTSKVNKRGTCWKRSSKLWDEQWYNQHSRGWIYRLAERGSWTSGNLVRRRVKATEDSLKAQKRGWIGTRSAWYGQATCQRVWHRTQNMNEITGLMTLGRFHPSPYQELTHSLHADVSSRLRGAKIQRRSEINHAWLRRSVCWDLED